MAIHGIVRLAPAAGRPAPVSARFEKALAQVPPRPQGPAKPLAAGPGHHPPAPSPAGHGQERRAAELMDRARLAQDRLDRIFHLVQSGRTFTPTELLVLQAQVCQASQQLDLAGRVVEKATSGVKQVLQTQV